MTISPLLPTNSAFNHPIASTTSRNNLDYSAFLRLFIASMKNQDPTKPNDPTQTMAQLASFSNVEQSIKLNEKLDALLSTTNAAVAATLIGKAISSLDGKTSGTVISVDSSASGLRAELQEGSFLFLSEGYRIRAS